MKNKIKPIYSLSFLIVFIIGCCNGHNKVFLELDQSPELLNPFIKSEPLKHASIAIKAVDILSGKTLIEYNPDLTLIPASTLKLLTTATALEALSPGHTFTTELCYTGYIDNQRTLHGNLVVSGGGDPTLGSQYFTEHHGDVFGKMAETVKKAGINRIEGEITGDASIFGEVTIPDSWIWEDIGNYYGACANGLAVNDNSYLISFSTLDGINQPAVITGISPEIPGITFNNQVSASGDNRDNAYIYGSYLSDRRIIRGTVPAGRSNFTIKGSVPDPALLAAALLREKLIELNIVVSGGPVSIYSSSTDKKVILSKFQSPTLEEIVRITNSKSINLYAETLLLHLSLLNGNPSVENGCNYILDFWAKKGMPTGGIFLKDGSGLSPVNGITAEQLAYVLRYMKKESVNHDSFIHSLPVSGVSGNLINFGTETVLIENLKAKSGSMDRMLNYGGYFTTTKGREAAFVVMVNNYEGEQDYVRSLIVKLLTNIVESF